MPVKHVAGDYDGDGKTDFAVWRPSQGNWFVIPSSTGTPKAAQQWGTPGDIPVPGDYDGDGKTDFAVWRPSQGNWFVIPSSTGTPKAAQQWGLQGDIPVPGDYDGDGKTDFALWRPSEGNWYVIPSSTGTPKAAQQWGLLGDIPVPGDYDGDGKMDFAVWRPSEGNWYVIPSSTGTPKAPQQCGIAGDIPVPGDYDGDGKTDLAVWRPSTGEWFIVDSSTGTLRPSPQQWGALGDIPAIRTKVHPNMLSGSPARGDGMNAGEVLNPDDSITSADGQFFFVYQTDGNLVLYSNRTNSPLWASNTGGKPAGVCIMQTDGNLVVYDPDARPLWASNTAGNAGSRLVVQGDGNVVIYRQNGSPAWATNTVQPVPPSTVNWPWAIILCRFNDLPTIPQQPDFYVDLYTRNGLGGLCDYWREVSGNALDLTGSKVFGWFTMPHASTELNTMHFPGDRAKLVQWGKDAAAANGIDLTPFKQVLTVHNYGVDHGFAGNGVIIVHSNPSLCEFGFISHEMGHGFGLPHSFSADPDMEYGDGWDVMSFATTTFQVPIAFRGTQGAATVGLNARNLDALRAVPERRMWIPSSWDFSEQVTLDPLNQPLIGNRGFLVAKIVPNSTRPRRSSNSSFVIECRRKAAWDIGIPNDTVLVHEIRTNGLSYLQPTIWGQFTLGQQFVTPDPKVFVKVTAMDPASGSATVRIWNIPEASVRKEDSKPNVYLIENGTKRWVTSPQVLFNIGKSWADVRVVPDGGLSSIPAGSDVV